MSDHSHIQWTDATWNPTTGCTKISPGCAHCYIERTPAFRIAGRRFVDGHIPVQLHADRLEQPLRWRRPRRVFVNSLSDLFHEDVPATYIADVFGVMAHARQHTFQVLTKRADRMRELLSDPPAGVAWPLPNVWLGVSVENQHFADERIPLLLQTPAAVRFVSAEPLLGPVDLDAFLWPICIRTREEHEAQCEHGLWCDERALDWVIVGGESGPGARPLNVAWARSIVEQCRESSVACFVKQLGDVPVLDEAVWRDGDGRGRVALLNSRNHRRAPVGTVPLKFSAPKSGDPSEWPSELRVRQFPEARP